MPDRAEKLRADCRRYIDQLEAAGASDPLVITSLRSLVSQNSSTAETARRLWHDNVKLRAGVADYRKALFRA